LWIIGSEADVHVAALKTALSERNLQYRSLGFGRAEFALRSDAPDEMTKDDVGLWRYKSRSGSYVLDYEMALESWCDQEWYHMLIGCCARSEMKLLNGPPIVAQAGIKALQLLWASECGLRVPDYCISNNKNDLTDFLCRHEKIIKKPLAGSILPDPSDMTRALSLGTMRLNKQDLFECSEDRVEKSPVYLQEEIEKICEYRVIVVGNRTIAYQIESQVYPETQLDWRHGQLNMELFSIVDLDEEVVHSLNEYLKKAQLFSGVFDLAKDINGRIIFFECNPNGQWLFMDDLSPGLVARAFAEQLELRVF
jgi:hypothetical protein